ncbi:hypothetical protein [Ralstonia sp. 24A2]|uniref:hypothetical protein n=1 Tax=Ralstonia sp. 24A2 TaxID=3447364 RepID=UPI003F69819E
MTATAENMALQHRITACEHQAAHPHAAWILAEMASHPTQVGISRKRLKFFASPPLFLRQFINRLLIRLFPTHLPGIWKKGVSKLLTAYLRPHLQIVAKWLPPHVPARMVC